MLTVSQIINIGRISQYLSQKDKVNGALFGARLDPNLPLLIAMETDSLAWQYAFNPNDTTLTDSANYCYKIYGKYGLQAQSITGGGSSVTPSQPIGNPYLIPITGAMFTDATHYDNAAIVGKTLKIFFNDINRFLLSSEYAPTSTGINILIPGFDATQNPTYELDIFIVNP